jgi:hypothetical protein
MSMCDNNYYDRYEDKMNTQIANLDAVNKVNELMGFLSRPNALSIILNDGKDVSSEKQ